MKPIVKFFQIVWHVFDGLRKTLHLILLLLIFGLVLGLMLPHVPIVPSKAVLVINPQGQLVEQTTGGPLDRAVAEASGRARPETLLRDVVEAIRIAKDDHRVQGILLDLGGMSGGGLSKMQEITTALQEFRKAGKPIVAFGESYDQSLYYLAAHADEVYLDPHGMVFIDGFAYYRMFLKEAIDKLGIDVNVFRAGKFKSYTDQFSRNDMSEQEREESSAWLNALWARYQEDVTKARALQPQAIADYIQQIVPAMKNNGGDLAGLAAERGLVTELKTREQVEQRMMTLTGEDKSTHSFHRIDFEDYIEAERPKQALTHVDAKHIAIVVASGEILDGLQPSGTIGGDSLAALLRDARYDDDVAAVVLRIDSPGGSVFASEVIRREVDALKKAGKPVVASMSSTAASGGYYIAMNATEIWASPTTLTGSIGVFAVLPTAERTLAKIGVHTDGIGTTPLAGGFDVQRTLTEQQRELLQMTIDHEYKQFIANVADARRKTPDEIDAVAQGRVWAGIDAIEHGLIDKIGTLQEAIGSAAKLANLGEEYKLEFLEPETTWRQAFANEVHVLAARIADSVASDQVGLLRAADKLNPLAAEMQRIARFSDYRNAYFYCVCTVQ